MHLADPIEKVFRLTPDKKTGLHRLGIYTAQDLLHHLPARYENSVGGSSILEAPVGSKATIYGQLKKLKVTKGWKSKVPMTTAVLEDVSGTIQCIWFNQPYIGKIFAEGAYVRIEGMVTEKNGKRYIANGTIEKTSVSDTDSNSNLFNPKEVEDVRLYPIYPETKGISSLFLSQCIGKILGSIQDIQDPLPEHIRHHFHLPGYKEALIYIHQPKELAHAQSARKRFAFEEIFYIQLERFKQRKMHNLPENFTLETDETAVRSFISSLPFPLTQGQNMVTDSILRDLEKKEPMHRLLQGDVGSGKTVLAAIAAYAVVMGKIKEEQRSFQKRVHTGTGRLQVAYMAPTEILARQHFESFISFFKHTHVKIILLTSNNCLVYPSKSTGGTTSIGKTLAKRMIKDGSVSIIIGTHTLIQNSVAFRNIALAVIDEQHRFGVKQRKKLVDRHETYPHLLSMTATPIPRTLALTMYGDLDISVLDELPPGRMPVKTSIVNMGGRKNTYDTCLKELKAGRQLYVICPRIAFDENTSMQSVDTVAANLKTIFPTFRIGTLHGKQKSEDKERILGMFVNHDIDILVATSVVEVGINVPNATLMIIENAERFGLSQLHQLRGRIARGVHQGLCFLMSESEVSIERLSYLEKTSNGFELAEYDIQIRGIGELIGSKQWGVSDTAMEALRNIKLVEAARHTAENIIEEDAELSKYPLLKEKVQSIAPHIHFE